MDADGLVKPSSFALFHILSKAGSANDLEALFDVWDDLPVTPLKPGGHGGYSYDGIGYDVGGEVDEKVYPVHIVAANCGDFRMFKLLLNRGADAYVKDAAGRSVKDVDSYGTITRYVARHEAEAEARAVAEAERQAAVAAQWEAERKTKETAMRLKAEAQRARALAQRNRERATKQKFRRQRNHEREQRQQLRARFKVSVEALEDMRRRLEVAERRVRVQTRIQRTLVKERDAAVAARGVWQRRAVRCVGWARAGIEATARPVRAAGSGAALAPAAATIPTRRPRSALPERPRSAGWQRAKAATVAQRRGLAGVVRGASAVQVAARGALAAAAEAEGRGRLDPSVLAAAYAPLASAAPDDAFENVSACGLLAAFCRTAPPGAAVLGHPQLLQLRRLLDHDDSRVGAASAFAGAAAAWNHPPNAVGIMAVRETGDDAGALPVLQRMLESGKGHLQAGAAALVWQYVARATTDWAHPHTIQALATCVATAKNKAGLQLAESALEILAGRDLTAKYRLVDRLTPQDRITEDKVFVDYGRRAPLGTLPEVVAFHRRKSGMTTVAAGTGAGAGAGAGAGGGAAGGDHGGAAGWDGAAASHAVSRAMPTSTSHSRRRRGGNHGADGVLAASAGPTDSAAVIVVDLKRDEMLRKWVDQARRTIQGGGGGTTLEARAAFLAHFVATKMGDTRATDNHTIRRVAREHTAALHITLGPRRRPAVPIGSVHIGDVRTRSILFKVLADQPGIAVPCYLVRGDDLWLTAMLGHHCAWNLVRLVRHRGADRQLVGGRTAPLRKKKKGGAVPPPIPGMAGYHGQVDRGVLTLRERLGPGAVGDDESSVGGGSTARSGASAPGSVPSSGSGSGAAARHSDAPSRVGATSGFEPGSGPNPAAAQPGRLPPLSMSAAHTGRASEVAAATAGVAGAAAHPSAGAAARARAAAGPPGRGGSARSRQTLGITRAARPGRPGAAEDDPEQVATGPYFFAEGDEEAAMLRRRARARRAAAAEQEAASELGHDTSASTGTGLGTTALSVGAPMSAASRMQSTGGGKRGVSAGAGGGGGVLQRGAGGELSGAALTLLALVKGAKVAAEAREAGRLSLMRGVSVGGGVLTQAEIRARDSGTSGPYSTDGRPAGTPVPGAPADDRRFSRHRVLRGQALESIGDGHTLASGEGPEGEPAREAPARPEVVEAMWLVDVTRWSGECGAWRHDHDADAERYRRHNGVHPGAGGDSRTRHSSSKRLWFPRIHGLGSLAFDETRDRLGESATSLVCRAKLHGVAALDRRTPWVAVKRVTLPTGVSRASRRLRRRLRHDVRLSGHFRHPHVAAVHASFTHPAAQPTHMYVVMEAARTTLELQLAAFRQTKALATRAGEYHETAARFRAMHPGQDSVTAAVASGVVGTTAAVAEVVTADDEDDGEAGGAGAWLGAVGQDWGDEDVASDAGDEASGPSHGYGHGHGHGASWGDPKAEERERFGPVPQVGGAIRTAPSEATRPRDTGRMLSVRPGRRGSRSRGGPLAGRAPQPAVTGTTSVSKGASLDTSGLCSDLTVQGLDPSYIVDVMVDVALGLASLHAAGPSIGPSRAHHGDIRPSNVLLWPSEAGTVAKLTPVNISSTLRGFTGADTLTDAAAWRYLAPEAVRAVREGMRGARGATRVQVDPKPVDVYAFGVMLGHLATGLEPHETSSRDSEAPYSQDQVNSGCGRPEIGRVYAQCVVSDPTRRPSMQQIAWRMLDIALELQLQDFFGHPPLDDELMVDPDAHNAVQAAQRAREAAAARAAADAQDRHMADTAEAGASEDTGRIARLWELARRPSDVFDPADEADADYVDSDGPKPDSPAPAPKRVGRARRLLRSISSIWKTSKQPQQPRVASLE